ncbi:MAG TPA: hypothetical protein VFC39_16405 [Acidobacteriaceae bacterium]|nr:hypothetical protein [Acidobacteriaceae bacterium]
MDYSIPGAELAQSALLFEHPEDRFDDSFSAPISEPPVLALELAAHPTVNRSAGLAAAAHTQVEAARKVRVGHIRLQVLGFHLFQVLDGKEPAVGQYLDRRRPSL